MERLVLEAGRRQLTEALNGVLHERLDTTNGFLLRIPAVRGRFLQTRLSATHVTVCVDGETATVTFGPGRLHYLPGGDGYRAEIDEKLTMSGPRHWYDAVAANLAGTSMRSDETPQH